MIKMIVREIEIRSEYLDGKVLDSIYFGGGTPSLLEANEIDYIFNTINKLFIVSENAEITLEANPDDLSRNKIQSLKESGISRLSIGIQSFHDDHLKFLNRIHKSQDAINSVIYACEAGIENISIDLIYGISHTTHDIWIKDLEQAIMLNVPHISSYCLTIEPDTVFGKWVKQKKMLPANDDYSAEQFEILLEKLNEAGYEQYEISNFSRPGWHSRHNSNYWLGGKYLGAGPSAHSFNGNSRQYNISNNHLYIKELKKNTVPFVREDLSEKQKLNEYLMTRIRTKWGCDLRDINEKFRREVEEKTKKYSEEGYILYEGKVFRLTAKGKLLADFITQGLFQG
jgi:oxygen-independent coproporphyrinogen-3 oxidase